jgi:GT2 family glycosyltransferase
MPSPGTASSLEPADRTLRPSRGAVELDPLTTALAADVLAVHVEADGDEVEVAVECDGRAAELELFACTHSGDGERTSSLIVAIVAGATDGAEATLEVVAGGARHELGPAPLRRLGVDLRRFLRERLARLGAAERAALLEILVEVVGARPGSADPLGLAIGVALAREGLREPLPLCVVERNDPQGLHLDTVVGLSDRAFYVRGWARDDQAPLRRLTLVSPEGARAELLEGVHRTPRADVDSFYERPKRCDDDTGFLAYCETAAPSLLDSGWVLEMENELGVGREVAGPEVTRDLLGARAGILSDLQKERDPETPLMDHVASAVGLIQEQLDARTQIEEELQYGEPASDPEASIVVPLYGRIDFLEHQLAQFVHDPEMARADLIYVLDSPDLAAPLEALAGQLFELYGVPFRTVRLSQNGGFSIANNRGASLARGRMLLLLNSDVLPERPGWLSRMVEFHDDTEGVGALGVKLLFEDDTLQHAGIRFQRPPGGGAWENEHFFKGLHRSLPAANLTRRVPAVSGACLMIRRELYAELGGLRGAYVQGDYEDTDLCLRLREAGLDSWYLPEVELYHLEGQSYDLETRQAMSRYNVWLHTRLWNEAIEAAMAESEPAP